MQANTIAKHIRVLVAVAALSGVRFAAYGQALTPIPFQFDRSQIGLADWQGQNLTYVDKNGNPTQPGTLFVESIPGNGTRAGYMLSHGGVIPGSVRVSVGARTLKASVDYYLDYAGGTLMFTEAVRRFESISVSYKYVAGNDTARGMANLPGLALNLRGTRLNFAYGVDSANGLNFTTSGLSMASKLGRAGTLNSLLYFSNPNQSNANVAERTSAFAAAPAKANTAGVKSDRLMVQDLSLTSGKATFRATYQDVGRQFNGFQAMRQSNSGNADVLAQIGALEKERGIKRLGFGTGLQLSKSDKLQMDWDRVTDGSGQISKQSVGYTAGNLSLSYKTQTVGRSFNAFTNLREAEAAQWARERGIKRTDLTLNMAPAKGSALGFSRSTIGDGSGSIARQSVNFATKGWGFTYSKRSADQSFGRINDLSDADKTALALDIRRQFNANAGAGEVNAKDKEQIALDAGLDRTRLGFTSTLGKKGALGFNEFTIGDASGQIKRRTFNLSGSNFAFNYLDQTVSSGFSRLGRMSEFERSQFGNETGLRRTAMGLNMTLSKSSTLAVSQQGFRDSQGGLSRQSLAYAAKGFDARLNLSSVDKSFARARDIVGLSDADRNSIEAERGFKRMDLAANLTSLKGLTLSTYLYNADNAADQISRNVFRHAAAWTPSKSSRLTYLTEGNNSARAGAATDGTTHTLLTLDHQMARGMKFNAFRDTVASMAGGANRPTVTTNFMHFETDRSKTANLMAETKRIDFGNGTFENTTQFDANLRAGKTMSFRLNRTDIDRGNSSSSQTSLLSMNWQASKTLGFSGSFSQTSTGNSTGGSALTLALNGQLTKNLNFVGSYTEGVQQNTNVRAASSFALSNAKPVNFMGLKAATFTMSFANLSDQHRTQTQNVAGRVAGLLGKNQVAMEYGGILEQNRNSNIYRSFSFVSDRNAKLPIHFDLLYKARNVNHGELALTRAYNVALNLGQGRSLTYTYNSLPDGGGPVPQALASSAFAFNSAIGKAMNLKVDYTTSRDFAKKTAVKKLGALLSGKVDRLAAVQAGYSVDVSNLNGQNVNAHTLTLGYSRAIDADHSFGVSSAYTFNKNGQSNDVQGQVEFKTRF